MAGFRSGFRAAFQAFEHFLAGRFVLKQSDLKKLLAHQLGWRITQQLRHERIGVADSAGDRVEQEDAVVRRFKQPTVPDFRSAHFVLLHFERGNVHQHDATLKPGGRAFGADSDDLERSAFDR